VQNAIAALNASPLAADTVRALDWYFNSHTPETVSTARTSLTCIQAAIADTSTHSRFGCHPGYDALAYVCAHSHSICTDSLATVCFTSQHFNSEPRVRAQTAIHECAHRVGMSLGRPNSVDDIYRFTTRFLYQDTRDLLLNSDSYALFAGAISEGVRSSLLFSAAAGYGFASPTSGRRGTWQANLYLGAELQHPVLGLFSPTLGLGFTLIGESTGEPRRRALGHVGADVAPARRAPVRPAARRRRRRLLLRLRRALRSRSNGASPRAAAAARAGLLQACGSAQRRASPSATAGAGSTSRRCRLHVRPGARRRRAGARDRDPDPDLHDG
jgi:hypothetical protein